MADRCWCCDCLLTTKDICPLCDMAGMASPPHICIKNGIIIGDEDGCEPEFPAIEPDHETRATRA